MKYESWLYEHLKAKDKIWVRSLVTNILHGLKVEEYPISGSWGIPLFIFLSLPVLQFPFGLLSLSFKFKKDPISGCWDISLLIFWCHLPLEAVFIYRNFQFLFGPLGLSLKFEEDIIISWGRSRKWLSGYCPFEILRLSSIKGCLYCKQFSFLVWSPELKF